LTIKGHEIAQKTRESRESKIAFVAMSFDSEMIQIYNSWIEPAIKDSGFEPYIVLNQHPESDVTINDAILAGIKKAKFTIADFTHHKPGVYFEAGYALGRGQKVIYTCREDHIGTAHFDTRNYQHLVWKDGADLKKKLMDKIEVFIKV
jgi:nucleoside 2-deoxyribosyltransferase